MGVDNEHNNLIKKEVVFILSLYYLFYNLVVWCCSFSECLWARNIL